VIELGKTFFHGSSNRLSTLDSKKINRLTRTMVNLFSTSTNHNKEDGTIIIKIEINFTQTALKILVKLPLAKLSRSTTDRFTTTPKYYIICMQAGPINQNIGTFTSIAKQISLRNSCPIRVFKCPYQQTSIKDKMM